ncbi:protein unc-45 homolog A-like isoform X2 [Xyrauchen texanus]|uniref:protein unc-45 homolog A-like isoform X2 n=1 Tax=Xyrauchen texanus TaxID=154827 RepID=UPI002242A04B|nr:protein unc-45 homolog A-like isoform X2 [Xyrauchen texanus]
MSLAWTGCVASCSAASTVSLSACHLLQVMFEALTEGMKKEIRGKDKAILPEPSRELHSMLRQLIDMLPATSVSGTGRDSAVNLLVKQVPRKSLKNPDNSLTLWVIDQGINFGSSGMESKLCAIQTMSVLLQAPSDVGNRTLELSGIMEAVISLWASENTPHQQVAVAALIHAAGKAKRASFITANGVALLKDLYKKSDRIRVRALVGLCKLGFAGGTDFSMKQFAKGSMLILAKQCRKWLCNEALPPTSNRSAIEGLAYLTLDADVKGVEDRKMLQAMFELAKSEDKSVDPHWSSAPTAMILRSQTLKWWNLPNTQNNMYMYI